ncbi:Uma2 family endonuclease [Chloroflexus sp.]|uniref:Uma2 family endonuclease n=1 Tax=Chloroflexus sp. TaxID=1904827 RepID=UPI00298F1896|nr:Uma2 family endonuclease [Chloroflexus sp.]MCS6886834.1 Uma2 family endonuclease [Chloroflexus sp.]MDW8402843.1 Uma2 family endonuclease [Chloroflexus sp.]
MTSGLPAQHLRIATEDDETIVDLTPLQGLWTVEQYLAITDQSRRLLEYVDGTIEVLPMPTDRHQVISQALFIALHAYIYPRGGIVLYAPLRLRIRAGKFREPDALLLQRRDDPRRQNRYWLGADLVVEIVSPDDPERDTVVKRADYAEAGIPEYWIVAPDAERVIVLTLQDGVYHEAGVYQQGDQIRSVLLPELSIPVQAIFAAQ